MIIICIGSWNCEPNHLNTGGTATYVITLDKMGNGTPCPHTHGEGADCVPPDKRLGLFDGDAGKWRDDGNRIIIRKNYTNLKDQLNSFHDKIDCLYNLGPGYDVTVGHNAKDSGGPTFSMRDQIKCPASPAKCYFKPNNKVDDKVELLEPKNYRTGRIHNDKKSRQPTSMGMQGYLCGSHGDMFIPKHDKNVK